MRKIVYFIFMISLSGCANFSPQLGFKEVSEGFSARTNQYLYWNSGTPEDEKISLEISKLLSSELTADSATQIALLNNKGLQAVYQQLGLAQADLVEAGLISNPIFNADIRFPSSSPNLELSVVQNFVSIFEIPLRKKIAQSEFEEAKIYVIEKALQLSYQTRKAFYEYQASEQLLEAAKTALIALEASSGLATKLHRAGNITDLDLAQEQSNYESLKVEVAAQEEELILAREELNSLLGLEFNQTSWKAARRLPESFKLVLDDASKKAITNNLALAKARQRLLTLATSLDLEERFRFFGETELGVSGARESEGEWGFGPAISFPIPFFNQGNAQIYRVNAQLSQQHNLCLALQTEIESHTRSLLGRLKLVEAKLNRYKKVLLPLQVKLVNESQKQYNGMLIGAFQLLEVKRKQIETGKDYILALRSYWLLRTELESLLNGLVPSKVGGE